MVFSPNRLQQAMGNMAGAHLGFKQNPGGGMESLPETTAELVEIKKIYPLRRSVDFCFLSSDVVYNASALLDHWYREGLDDIQPPKDSNSSGGGDLSWPFTLPESDSPDLLTLISLITLVYPPAESVMPLIQQLIKTMGGQHNAVKLLKILANQNSFDLPSLLQLLKDKIPKDIDLKSLKLEDIGKIVKVPEAGKGSIPVIDKIKDISILSDVEIPKEPLYGVVIPLKGDKKQGYLLLGFIKPT